MLGVNIVGLKRRGHTHDAISALKEAHRYLFRSALSFTEAVEECRDLMAIAPEIKVLVEALRVTRRRGTTTFVGLDQAVDIEYVSLNNEETRCNFCPNNCSRTFIDTKTLDGKTARYISGFSCEKGTVENMDALKKLNKERQSRMKKYPNLVDYEAKLAFKSFYEHVPMPDKIANVLLRCSSTLVVEPLGRYLF